jgi:hypothetical protein
MKIILWIKEGEDKLCWYIISIREIFKLAYYRLLKHKIIGEMENVWTRACNLVYWPKVSAFWWIVARNNIIT